jgi:hypothetical protein
MKKILFLLCLVVVITQAWGQQQFPDADQYPEEGPQTLEESELIGARGLPPSDYEEVPREEQQYSADNANPVTEDLAPPEDVYEADEEYLE